MRQQGESQAPVTGDGGIWVVLTSGLLKSSPPSRGPSDPCFPRCYDPAPLQVRPSAPTGVTERLSWDREMGSSLGLRIWRGAFPWGFWDIYPNLSLCQPWELIFGVP